MVSEFKYYHSGQCDADAFESWVESNLEHSHQKDPYRSGCFFAPQVDYVFSANHDVQYCKHIIPYDNLEDEFNALMLSSDIPLSLMKNKYNDNTECEMEVSHKARKLIEKAFKADYQELTFS